MKLVISQIYFIFLSKIFQPEEVAVGSPISSTGAEMFLQYFEDKHTNFFLTPKT